MQSSEASKVKVDTFVQKYLSYDGGADTSCITAGF
jgi:hypothetical protein